MHKASFVDLLSRVKTWQIAIFITISFACIEDPFFSLHQQVHAPLKVELLKGFFNQLFHGYWIERDGDCPKSLLVSKENFDKCLFLKVLTGVMEERSFGESSLF